MILKTYQSSPSICSTPGTALGTHAGLLASSFCAAQFCSSMLWGRLADRIGLRPCLIAGTMGSAVAFIAFGLSANFSQAVMARAAAGLLNGNAGVLKSYIGRVTDATNQAKGLTLLSIAWGVGSFVAPIIGGVLCRPADTWPNTYKGTLFDEKPFLLPCAVVAVWGSIASLFLVVCLEEPPVSDGDHQPKSAGYSKVTNSSVELVSKVNLEFPTKTSRFKEMLESRRGRLSNDSQINHASEYETVRNPFVEVEVETTDVQISPKDGGTQLSSGTTNADTGESTFNIRSGNISIACQAYGLLALAQQMIDEALPLFMKLDIDEGGLGFSESDIGSRLAFGGIATLVISLFLVPRLERRYGAINIYRYSAILATPLYAFFWATSLIWGDLNYIGGWIVITALILAKDAFLSFGFAGAFVMVNNSVPKEHLGSVNGVGQTTVSLARTAGPALCGVFWSLGTHLHFVPLTFLIIGFASFLCVCISFRLPSSLRYKFGATEMATPPRA